MNKKKYIVISLLLISISLIGFGTYSYLRTNMTVSVKATSNKIVCDAEAVEWTNKYGYTELHVIVLNDDNDGNFNEIPFSYTVTIEKTSNNNVYFGTNNTFQEVNQPITLTGRIDSTTSASNSHFVQIKTDNNNSEEVTYKLSLNCIQEE